MEDRGRSTRARTRAEGERELERAQMGSGFDALRNVALSAAAESSAASAMVSLGRGQTRGTRVSLGGLPARPKHALLEEGDEEEDDEPAAAPAHPLALALQLATAPAAAAGAPAVAPAAPVPAVAEEDVHPDKIKNNAIAFCAWINGAYKIATASASEDGKTLEFTASGPQAKRAIGDMTPRVEMLKGVYFLSFFNLRFRTMSPNIGLLRSLRTLTFMNNGNGGHISVIPREVCALEHLYSLIVVGQWLEELPVEIYRLTHLQQLDVSHNKLTELPVTMARMRELVEVTVTGNEHLTSVPDMSASPELRLVLVNGTSITQKPRWVRPTTRFITRL